MPGGPRRDWRAFGVATVWALGSAALLWRIEPGAFTPYFGPLHPFLAFALVTAAAALSLHALGRAGAPPPAAGSGLTEASLLAAVFAAAVIAVDLTLGYPAGINLPWPRSLLFYPAMALVAQTVFILGPLAVAALILRPRQPGYAAFAVIALLEPAFQLWFAARDAALGWTEAYTALHVFLFGLAQLVLFRRAGFAAMFALRIFYYALWHVAWGALRLPWIG